MFESSILKLKAIFNAIFPGTNGQTLVHDGTTWRAADVQEETPSSSGLKTIAFADVTQGNTDPPGFTIAYSDFPTTGFTFVRVSEGLYEFTLPVTNLYGAVVIITNGNSATSPFVTASIPAATKIRVQTKDLTGELSDGILDAAFVVIHVLVN
jgi:hypothetical protein